MADKPWLKPGANLSDYFNYGFNEKTWNEYAVRKVSPPPPLLLLLLTFSQHQMRLESQNQAKIAVFDASSSSGSNRSFPFDVEGREEGDNPLPNVPMRFPPGMPPGLPFPPVLPPGVRRTPHLTPLHPSPL